MVGNPKSSVDCGWYWGGIQTSWVLASDVTLQISIPIVTLTSDSSQAKFKFSPYLTITIQIELLYI